MATLSPQFLIFDSKPAPESENGGLVYCCSSKDANVQWPKTARRGRPRKDPKEDRRLKHTSNELYEFVNCSDGQRPNDPNTRKLVRTHVMYDYRRQKQIAAPAKRGLQVMEIARKDNDAEIIVGLERPLTLPPERWSMDPFDSLPIEMPPHRYDLLYLYVSVVAEYLYPIEAHWGFNPTKKLWVPLALTDRALLSSVLCSADQFRARMNGRNEPPSTINHLKQTIQILNERLQNPLQATSNPTIAAVAGLALAEQSSGNQENWRIHMKGIRRMVEMRGGLSAFESNPILHDKLCRADICGSVHDLSKPYLQMDIGRVQPSVLQDWNMAERTLASGFQAVHDGYGFDSDLVDILYKVHNVTQHMNIVNPPKSEIIPIRLRKIIRSVQYDFLVRENYHDISSSGHQLLQACRIGVMLYVGLIQNEFWVSPINKKLIWNLKSCLESQTFATNSLRALRLWLLFLAGSLALEPTEKLWVVCYVAQTVSQLSLSNWSDAKSLLETFAWAGRIQDKSGQDLWNEAMRVQRYLQA